MYGSKKLLNKDTPNPNYKPKFDIINPNIYIYLSFFTFKSYQYYY